MANISWNDLIEVTSTNDTDTILLDVAGTPRKVKRSNLNAVKKDGDTMTGKLVVSNTTEATSSDGAIRTAGGLSVAKGGFFGGALTLDNGVLYRNVLSGTSIIDVNLNGDGVSNYRFRIGSSYTTTGEKGLIIVDHNTTANAQHLLTSSNAVSYLCARGNSLAVGTTSVNPNSKMTVNGNFNATGIYTNTTGNSANVYTDSNGLLYRSTSSERYKRDIEPADDTLADILDEIEVIWYRSKCVADNQDWSYWGIIAERLAEIDPRFVFWGYVEEDYEEVDVEVDSTEVVMEIVEEIVPETEIQTIELEVVVEKTGEKKTIEREIIIDTGCTLLVEKEVHKEVPCKVIEKQRQLKANAKMRPVGVQYERLTTALIKARQLDKKKLNDIEARLEKAGL